MEAIQEGSYVANGQDFVKPVSNESITNDPELMKRHRADVEFHRYKIFPLLYYNTQ